MKKFYAAMFLALLAGCNSSHATGPVGAAVDGGVVIRSNAVPVAVTAAFTAQHPYAKMTQAAVKSRDEEPDQYTLRYTRPDNSTGTATYAATGALLKDNQ